LSAGNLKVIGLGPGPASWLSHEATDALSTISDLVGYAAYVERAPAPANVVVHASDNRVELDRARHALTLAQAGRRVAVVSGGDPGVFAMAAAVFEAVQTGPSEWRQLAIEILPGISAMHAAAARVGAPLGGDFCAISLSDNLKPWSLIVRRLRAASEGDFVLALYNPASVARPEKIHEAFRLLREWRDSDAPVVFARAVGRADERVIITTLKAADPSVADMSTLVLIGASNTCLIERPGRAPWVLTPRRYGETT
jgi:precorrin-3B C17-methyltransferase